MSSAKRTDYPFELFEHYSTIFIIPWIITVCGVVAIAAVIGIIHLFPYYCKHC